MQIEGKKKKRIKSLNPCWGANRGEIDGDIDQRDSMAYTYRVECLALCFFIVFIFHASVINCNKFQRLVLML
jgi:hypothetical protein